MPKKKINDLSKAVEKLAKAKDTNTSSSQKNVGGRPSHTNQNNRQKLTITLSKSTVKKMEQSLVDNTDPLARNKSHMIEIAILQYLEKLKEE